MKPLFTFICIILVFCMLAIPAAAYSPEIDGANEADGITEGEDTQTEEGDETENVFELIYREIGKYTSEIFCAASLIGTVVLSFLYKKGLLPVLKGGIAALSGTVTSIKENSEKYSNEILAGKNALISGLERTDEILDALTEKIGTLEADLNAIESIERREAAIEVIMKAQVEALSEIFMSSSLPEYQKAALGEKIAAMKEALKDARQECAN